MTNWAFLDTIKLVYEIVLKSNSKSRGEDMSAKKRSAADVMGILEHIIKVVEEEKSSGITKVEILEMESKKGNGSPRIKFQCNGSGLRITASNSGVSQSISFPTPRPKQLKNRLLKILLVERKKSRKKSRK